jgi:hypothetical protein
MLYLDLPRPKKLGDPSGLEDLRDVHGLIADPPEVEVRVQDAEHQAQVGGDRFCNAIISSMRQSMLR